MHTAATTLHSKDSQIRSVDNRREFSSNFQVDHKDRGREHYIVYRHWYEEIIWSFLNKCKCVFFIKESLSWVSSTFVFPERKNVFSHSLNHIKISSRFWSCSGFFFSSQNYVIVSLRLEIPSISSFVFLYLYNSSQ